MIPHFLYGILFTFFSVFVCDGTVNQICNVQFNTVHLSNVNYVLLGWSLYSNANNLILKCTVTCRWTVFNCTLKIWFVVLLLTGTLENVNILKYINKFWFYYDISRSYIFKNTIIFWWKWSNLKWIWWVWLSNSSVDFPS